MSQSQYVITAAEFGEPQKGEIVDEIIDTAIVPWMLDPQMESVWEEYKKESLIITLTGFIVTADIATTIAANALSLPYTYLVGKIGENCGDRCLEALKKRSGTEFYTPCLKVQTYEYRRGWPGFLRKLRWHPTGEPRIDRVDVTHDPYGGGIMGIPFHYNKDFEAYERFDNAAKALDHVLLWENKFGYQSRYGDSRWRE